MMMRNKRSLAWCKIVVHTSKGGQGATGPAQR
jgi:hypothetical protein